MWTLRKRTPADDQAATCPTCDDELEHCHGVLVLHADGRAECWELPGCDGGLVEHDDEVACHELGCGCLGDEAPLDVGMAVAA